MNTALFYGSTTGNTGDVAEKFNEVWDCGNVDLFDVADTPLSQVSDYDFIIFALPTWDYGEVQEDWLEIWDEVDALDMSGKKAAFIGLGDQFGYPEWFVDAMGLLHDKVVKQGADVVGNWPIDGYEFEKSKALTPDKKHFVGLAIDEDWQSEQTDDRLQTWCSQLKTELGIG